MGITVVLPKRSGQESPITPDQWDSAMTSIEDAFASISYGTGSVTSVGLTAPSIFSVSGSPVTTSGSLTFSLVSQAANRIFAGPSSGGSASPTFRALVSDDLPTVPPAKGGTGATSFTASRAIVSDGSGNLASSSVTSTELGYLSGVTSAIQTQLNGKQSTITVLGVVNGGTGASTAQGARISLLPSMTGNSLKFLRVNAGETDYELANPTAGISSLNSQTQSSQTFSVATTGSDFTITSSGGVHTFALPNAGAAARGVVSTGAQTFAGQKTFATSPIISGVTQGQVVYFGSSGELKGGSGMTFSEAFSSVTSGYFVETKQSTVSSDTTLDENYAYVRCNAPALAITITLPVLAPQFSGVYYKIKDVGGNASAFNVTVAAQGGNTLDGVANGTKKIDTDHGCLVVKGSDDGVGNLFWEIVSLYKSV